MTDTVVVALIAAGPPTIVGAMNLAAALRNGKKSDSIHVLVNSNLTAVKADLQVALERVKQLERHVAAIAGKSHGK